MPVYVTLHLSNSIINSPVIIFLSVSAHTCMFGYHIYIVYILSFFSSAAIQWIIVSLHDPQSLNVSLKTFMYACTEHCLCALFNK